MIRITHPETPPPPACRTLEVEALESEFEEWGLDGAGGSASGSGARADPIRPMTPATFPVLAPNPLFKKDGLKVT